MENNQSLEEKKIISNIKEYRKQYYDRNKEKIIEKNLQNYYTNKDLRTEQMRDYHNKNRDIILQKRNEGCLCNCGGKYTLVNQAKHFKSKKHIAYLEQQ